jgi:hypothetical protein
MIHHPRIGSWLIAASAGIALAAGAATPAPSPGKSGRLSYKWVDEQGITHYGDGIPPEARQANAKILNRNAVPVSEVVGAKPAPQQEAEVRSEEAAAKQRKHDRFLLTTYTSVRDIEQLRDERISQLSAQVTSTQANIEAVGQRLQTLQMRASNFKPYSSSATTRRLPDTLAEELVQAVNEDRAQREYLGKRQAEINATRDSFQTDIDRYRQLVGR